MDDRHSVRRGHARGAHPLRLREDVHQPPGQGL